MWTMARTSHIVVNSAKSRVGLRVVPVGFAFDWVATDAGSEWCADCDVLFLIVVGDTIFELRTTIASRKKRPHRFEKRNGLLKSNTQTVGN